MKKKCFPIYLKFLFLLILMIIFMLISIITEQVIYVFLMFLTGFLITLLRCPKCGKMLGTTKNGWTTPFYGSKCNKCGENLLKCTKK